MGLKLIVDSASDISIEEAKELGIRVMPLSISFADKDYKDGVDLSKLEFYKKLKESSELPKTSQVSPYEFDQAINDVVSNGDAAIVITIASTLSGTYSSATIAASNYPDDKVVVIDSMTASVGERVLVLYALDLIKQGLDIKEIAKILNKKKEKIRIVYLMDTLETLYKGGRLSRLETMTGSILGVKPILALTDGKIKLVGKARGSKKATATHVDIAGKYGSVDLSMPHCMSFSGENIESVIDNLKPYENFYNSAFGDIDLTVMGATVGTHVGPGAVALGFFSK